MAKKPEVWQGGVEGGLSGRIRFTLVPNPDFEIRARLPLRDSPDPGLTLGVTHPSKGGGFTRIWSWLPEGMFLEVAKAMAKASPNAAEQAFLTVLTEGAKARAKRP